MTEPLDPTWALLARAGLTVERLQRGLALAGSADQLRRVPAAELLALEWPQAAVSAVRSPDQARLDADLEIMARRQIRLLPCVSAAYPARLAEVRGAPAVLYVRGSLDVLSNPQLAVVGSRHPTPAGRRTSFQFARHLARGGLTITSGLALGIDAAAHEGALAADPARTIAVCGTGLDVAYPDKNRALAEKIAAEGALISEFPPGSPPVRGHFPQRNRLISGLSLGVLVVEAARRSGSLITARHAGDQGREVFAIPGSIHSPLSGGCHQLIRAGAKLVETADDILTELPDFHSNQEFTRAEFVAAPAVAAAPSLDKEYEILLDALGFEPTSVDLLASRTGLPSESVASMLLILELEGHIQPHSGGRYGRVPQEP